MQQNQQALGVLLSDTGESNTYGADGQRNSSAGRRNLGSA
jgi:flagellar biosynthesis/type III secretory pathway chaperone